MALLWIHGAPGTGKSTLCSVIVNDLLQRYGQQRTTLFCFSDKCIGRMESSQCLLRTIMYQMLGAEERLVPRELLR